MTMAKVQQNSEKITAFGGIIFVLDKFGFITVEGVDERTNVSVYTTDGKQVGSAIFSGGGIRCLEARRRMLLL